MQEKRAPPKRWRGVLLAQRLRHSTEFEVRAQTECTGTMLLSCLPAPNSHLPAFSGTSLPFAGSCVDPPVDYCEDSFDHLKNPYLLRTAIRELSQQKNLGAQRGFNGLLDSRESNTPLGFSSRATTGNHRTPTSYYRIIPAEQPRSYVSSQ